MQVKIEVSFFYLLMRLLSKILNKCFFFQLSEWLTLENNPMGSNAEEIFVRDHRSFISHYLHKINIERKV